MYEFNFNTYANVRAVDVLHNFNCTPKTSIIIAFLIVFHYAECASVLLKRTRWRCNRNGNSYEAKRQWPGKRRDAMHSQVDEASK